MPGSQGFTLLEVLLSIATLALLTLVLAGSLRLAHRSAEAGTKRVQDIERARAAFTALDSQVMSLIPVQYTDERGQKVFDFDGMPDTLSFYSNYSIWGKRAGGGGYNLVSYVTVQNNDGFIDFVATETDPVTSATRSITLFQDLTDVAFEYYDWDPSSQTGDWVSEWILTVRLPVTIRVSLMRENGEIVLPIPFRTRPPTKGGSGGKHIGPTVRD